MTDSMKVFYSDRYTLSDHDSDTTRKAGWLAASLKTKPISGVELVEPSDASWEDLIRVHDPNYVNAVRTGEPIEFAESSGIAWDPKVWSMVLASNGGVIEATKAALRDGVAGSLSSGLHHARYGRGAGFCTFNGLVLAAYAAKDQGAENVLILDLDAHCGGGTHLLTRDLPWVHQIDIAVDAFDVYAPTARQQGLIVESSSHYLDKIQKELRSSSGPKPDLVIYNAGMDPHESSAIGRLKGITFGVLSDRERLVFQWCDLWGIPIVFVLAGGYTGKSMSQELLVNLHRETISWASTIRRQ